MPEAGIINVSFYNGHVIINNFLKARLVTEKGIIVLYYEPIVDFLYNFRNYIYIHTYMFMDENGPFTHQLHKIDFTFKYWLHWKTKQS